MRFSLDEEGGPGLEGRWLVGGKEGKRVGRRVGR